MTPRKPSSWAERIVRLGRLVERYEVAYFGAWGVAAGLTMAVILVLGE